MITKLACDFETVVTGDKKQNNTEVWSAASIDLSVENTLDNVVVQGSIEDFFKYIFSIHNKVIGYFHNEKFDGSFILDYLLKNGYNFVHDVKEKDMKNKDFSCLISAKGQWYSIKIKHGGRIYEFRDSYKLLPFSLKSLGKSFKTEHQKLEMEYTGERYANCVISEEEMEYIKNDVLVLKEALNIMEDEGHTKMTIGSCCMSEWKNEYHPSKFKELYPNLYGLNFPIYNEYSHDYGSYSAGDYIRKSYKGGWCYLLPNKANKLYTADIEFNGKKIAGTTCDVNSLYPSMMHSESGNRYPIGNPHFFIGDIPDYVENDDEIYYFVRVKTRFYLKEGKLPTVQIKDNILYHGRHREWLESSDYRDKDGNYYKEIFNDITGEIEQVIPELTLTKTDWILLNEHYNLEDTVILDGCWFYTDIGIFDNYINKYAKIKMESKGAKRGISKLFLNNLYGKTATSVDASIKVPFLDEDGIVHFYNLEEENVGKAGYIPIGTAITSYARNFTIRAAQANYDNFIYADTDSIHCNCSPDDIIGCPEDPVKFNCWKYEACWIEGIFVRPKTYIEFVSHENREPVDKPYYNVKCAGMPDRAKSNFVSKLINEPLNDDNIEDYEKYIGIKGLNEDEIAFHRLPKMTLEDFKVGLTVPGSLKPKRVIGGVVLFSNDYVMRPHLI